MMAYHFDHHCAHCLVLLNAMMIELGAELGTVNGDILGSLGDGNLVMVGVGNGVGDGDGDGDGDGADDVFPWVASYNDGDGD